MKPLIQRPTFYRKNGILVGHTGQTITSEDVAKVMAEDPDPDLYVEPGYWQPFDPIDVKPVTPVPILP